MVGNAENVGRGLAHRDEAREMRGEFVDAVEVEIEFDEPGECGLIEGIDGDGAHEGLAGGHGGVDLGEALRDREEILGAEVRLVEIICEEEAGRVEFAETEVGDGAKAVEHGLEAGGKVLVRAEERISGVEGAVKIASRDEGFDMEECVWLPGKIVGLRVIEQAASEPRIAGVGGEIGEGKERGRIGRKIAEKGVGFASGAFGSAGAMKVAEQFDARAGQAGVGDLKREAVASRLVAQAGFAEAVDEFGMNLAVVGALGGEGPERNHGEFAIAAGPVDFRGKQAAVARVGERGDEIEEIFRLIEIAAKVARGGGGKCDEAVAFGRCGLAWKEGAGERDHPGVLLLEQ